MGKKIRKIDCEAILKLSKNRDLKQDQIAILTKTSRSTVQKIIATEYYLSRKDYDALAERIKSSSLNVNIVELVCEIMGIDYPEKLKNVKKDYPTISEEEQKTLFDIYGYEQEKEDGYVHNYGSPVVARLNVIINRLDRLIELWEK